MAVQEFVNSIVSFFNLCAVYYVIQLLKCAQVSILVFGLVCFLRKTLLKNKVFLKGAVWALFLPALFVGKMKFFYENRIGALLFSWWAEHCKIHIWINWLYLCGVSVYALWLHHNKRKLKKLLGGMEKKTVEGTLIYVTKMPVTPSTIGVFRPKIVMPKAMLKKYSQKEIQLILLHEKTHIQLGHLLFYLLWDILRALLWLNPLLTIGTKFFREDLEEICDIVTIQRSGGKAYEYGRLLLNSIKALQAESEGFNMFASFAGDIGYQYIRQRMERIAQYRPYKPIVAASSFFAAILFVVAAVVWIKGGSYGRYNENSAIFTYGFDGGKVTFFDDNITLQQMISYDRNYVYVDREAFEKYLYENHASGDIFIVFGGFYKLPGIGGNGYSCCYSPGSKERVVKVPYEASISDWRIKVLKML